MSRQLVPRLVADVKDVCVQKILVAARSVGLELALEAPRSKAAVPELHLGNSVISHTNAILRYIGRVFESSDLYGTSFFESSQVDSWIDYADLELSHQKPPQLSHVIEALERQLADRVYVVGHRYTLADISLSCSLHHFSKQGLIKDLPRATNRWLKTCTMKPAFCEVIGTDVGVTPSALATYSAPSASSKSAGGSGPPCGGPIPGAQAEDGLITKYSSCVGGRTRVKVILGCEDRSLAGKRLTVCGWVRTKREGGKGTLVFLNVNDGSCAGSLQIVCVDSAPGFERLKAASTGASVVCTGEVVISEGKGQALELLVKQQDHNCAVLGGSDPKDYPLAKKKHGMEFLRENAHLRPRTGLISCVARVRSALATATHDFFRSRGFLYVHTPLITASDCEGAGELFQVTTLLGESDALELPKVKGKDGKMKIDYEKDFFHKRAFLTVSGQLSVENYACALSNVYTFGPTFRAEKSHTTRHLSEFWMIEPELCFANLTDNMDCAEDYVKFCLDYVLTHNREDLVFLEGTDESRKGLPDRLEAIKAAPFGRMTYTEVVETLIKESQKANFSEAVAWGMDLGSEHERYLVEKVTMKPTFVYNYPKEIKAFYMRLNDDRKTVGAMDMLVPGIGELIGGSAREERLDVLDLRIEEMGLDKEDYWWFRDLRKYGSVPHAGFGLGFERLIMLVTGIENIRDVIPYPRYPGHAEF